jgi:manganese transport system substrate-binding protein
MANFKGRPPFTASSVPHTAVAGPTLATVLSLALSACGSQAAAEDPSDGRPTVLATFTVIADMAENVAGDAVNVQSLTGPGTEIHTYEPTPEDLARASQAELILANGLGLEAWLERFTDRLDAPTATVSEGIDPLPIASGDYAGQDNPHAWMSPGHAEIYVDNIRTQLSDLAPDHAEEFAANAEAYTEEIREIAVAMHDDLDALPEAQRALVTCEGAFTYLARDAGLEEMYLWPVNAEEEPTPGRIAEVVEFVRDNEVPAVFCESTVNDGPQRQVAAETGAEFAEVLYVDSLSPSDGPVPTYLDLLRHDAEAIAAGLGGSR